MFYAADHALMARALQLAERGLFTARPNPRVGCVLVRDGQIVGEGYHQKAGLAHAEPEALKAAGELAKGATAYVTLEPCCHQGRTPPCTDALIQAGIVRVVAAMRDPNPKVAGRGLEALKAAGIATEVGLCEQAAEKLNAGFIRRMRDGRPWLRIKSAISLDGRTAMASGESLWITGEAARADVQRWRARSCAILTGSGTIKSDDPSLNLRLSQSELDAEVPVDQPIRVVLDSALATRPDARWLSLAGRKLIFTASGNEARSKEFVSAGAEVYRVPMLDSGLNLKAVMHLLAELEVNEVQVEAGAKLNGALIESGLVDEFLIYLAPHLMGDAGFGLASMPGLKKMQDRISLVIDDVRAVGADWRIHAHIARGCHAS